MVDWRGVNALCGKCLANVLPVALADVRTELVPWHMEQSHQRIEVVARMQIVCECHCNGPVVD